MLAIGFWNIHKNPSASSAIVDIVTEISSSVELSGASGEVIFCLSEPGNLDIIQLHNDLKASLPLYTWQFV